MTPPRPASNQRSNGDFDESCVFCLIGSGQDAHAEVIGKNDELVCFRDICPAAPHHYLVVPRQHILSCFSLQPQHIGLVEKMADMGRAALHDQGITNMKDIRLGFHKPPYTSVDHLHLHVLAPASQISDRWIHKFRPGTHKFVTEEDLRNVLQKTNTVTETSEGLGNIYFSR
ncbi:adenosine 5'-monophosphoramidase HINT3-like [Lampris incognitus]|uniref:adenosine 5'-monophosphoramidase HINT3-like n=1 Tax=Lampris incognitus TaxID=2546036 RepID=UPI0024B5F92D|nr:adenosine 5'-monophosphoramidase HINT3-like [Lampris incognitus]